MENKIGEMIGRLNDLRNVTSIESVREEKLIRLLCVICEQDREGHDVYGHAEFYFTKQGRLVGKVFPYNEAEEHIGRLKTELRSYGVKD